jgi:ADP-heptose:LPS heptosyltransferase
MRQDDVKYHFVRYTRGIGLDLSVGAVKAFPHMLGVREKADPEAKLPHITVENFGKLDSVKDESCDFILHAGAGSLYCDEWFRCLKDGGYLCLYTPQQTRAELADRLNFTTQQSLIRQQNWQEGGAFVVLRKGTWPMPEQHEKTVCIVRHGGIGDQLQAAYLLPELKRQGFHITLLTTDRGREILRDDPHIDDWFMVDTGQVPVPELVRFWNVIAKDYDRFVNLNESVEGTFLAISDRVQHGWPHALRHRMMNHNYAEFAASLAEIPFVPEGKFYPDADEVQSARERMVEIRRALAAPMEVAQPVFVIMWVLAGSSPHKFTPHQDTVMRMILGTLKRAVVVLVGDDACKILEAGWEEEPRVTRYSGELHIRDTLALAQEVDLLIGPETGVMNAVCYEDMPKVVMLSHSSAENLTKHWRNTEAIPGVAPCAPCHQLHHDSTHCPQDAKLGGAVCQSGVDPMALFRPIREAYDGWARVQMLRAA